MTIRVVRDQLALMRHEIHIGQHSLASDLSVEEGGGGSAPNPHDLYDAALGACTALTVLWYAKRKNIPLEGIEVSVDRDASQERAGVYRLSAALTLTGELGATQREELLRAAQKCPIHKLMTEVTTEISVTLSQ
jgi:putative redox protein